MEHRSQLLKTHLDSSIGFRNNYPLDSDLSSVYHYIAFEQPTVRNHALWLQPSEQSVIC